MQRFYASFRPDLLDPEFAGLADGHPGCATEVLADVRAHWDEVSAEDRHLIEMESSPIYRAWLGDGGISWLEGDVDLERSLSRGACFTPQDTEDPNMGSYANVTTTDHFEMHWNPNGTVTQGKIDDLLSWFEESWQFQVVDRGFFQPAGLSTNQMLVTVEQLNNDGVGAYASLSPCFGGYMTYIVMNEWSFGDLDWLRATAAHEFFHGVQPVYALQEFWGGITRNRWLVESTATYMQRVVYDWLTRVEAEQAFRWSLEPHRSLETADDSGLQYGLVVFHLSITESLGSNEWHQALWDQIYDRAGYELRDEFDTLLAPYDTDFLTEWRRFIIRGATGLAENPDIISPIEFSSTFGGNARDRIVGRFDGRDYPIDENVNSGSGHDRPEYLGTNYAVFEGERIDDDVGAILTFRGEGEKDGDRIEWVVELAAVYNDTVRATHSMVLEREGGDVFGEVLVNEIGEDFDYVVMAVSPVTDFGGGVASWSFTGELADSTGPGGFVPVPDEVVPDDGQGCSGCASSLASTKNNGGALLGALLMGALLRRRREGSER